jgi:membrane protein implicated in regulation of membrane protease activity
MIWQEWWIWVVFGVVLALLELLAPAFVLLGFSIGVISTGILLALGLVGGSLSVMILIAAVISLGAWLVMRKIFGRRRGQVKIWDKDINDN